MTALALSHRLPRRYVAAPQVHPGSAIEIDVATYDGDEADPPSSGTGDDGGGPATVIRAPPEPAGKVTPARHSVDGLGGKA
jgi:hypothetical protein